MENDQNQPITNPSSSFDPNEYVTEPIIEDEAQEVEVEPFSPDELAAAIAEATSFGLPPGLEEPFKLQMATRSRRVIEILGGHKALAKIGVGGGGWDMPPFLSLALTGLGVGAMAVITRRAYVQAAKMGPDRGRDDYRDRAQQVDSRRDNDGDVGVADAA